MSEDTSVAVEKKISKSEAVRQAVAQLGVGADSALIRQKAIDVYGVSTSPKESLMVVAAEYSTVIGNYFDAQSADYTTFLVLKG